MSHDNAEIIVLKNQIDQIQDLWLNLSDQISCALSSLEPATKLAKTYENGKDKLMSWLKIALGELTGLGPIPSEPEAVQELKIRIDVRNIDRQTDRQFMYVCFHILRTSNQNIMD